MGEGAQSLDLTPIEIREVQLIQLEMLIEADRICSKHKIPYWIIGGTLMGSIRHRGFIPWDPDADIMLRRSDYERFFEVCKTELDTDRFFFQEWRTDPEYRWGYSRILRNGTEFHRGGYEHMKQKNGVFIDIMISDNVPDSPVLRPVFTFVTYAIRKILWAEAGRKYHPKALMRLWYSLLYLIPHRAVCRFRDWLANRMDRGPTTLTRNISHPRSIKWKHKWGVKAFVDSENVIDNGTMYGLWCPEMRTRVPFEAHYFLALQTSIDSLQNTFGDYLTLPPTAERKSHIPCSKLVVVQPELAPPIPLKDILTPYIDGTIPDHFRMRRLAPEEYLTTARVDADPNDLRGFEEEGQRKPAT